MATVRQIRSHEWELLRTVRPAALADAPYAFLGTVEQAGQTPDSKWEQRAQVGAEGKETVSMLAFDNGNVIGMSVGLRDEVDSALSYLVGMWVSPAWRGTHIAAALADSVTSWARGIGAISRFRGCLEKTKGRAKDSVAWMISALNDGQYPRNDLWFSH